MKIFGQMDIARFRRMYSMTAVGAALCTGLAAAPAEQNWFGVSRGPRIVEVDLSSIGVPLLWHEARLRVTFPADRRHEDGFSYRSLQSVVRFDCAASHVDAIAVTYFDGPRATGRELATESDVSDRGTRPVAQLVGTAASEMLLKAACALRRETRLVSGVCPYGGDPQAPSLLSRRNCDCSN